jgi:hypothetical protein
VLCLQQSAHVTAVTAKHQGSDISAGTARDPVDAAFHCIFLTHVFGTRPSLQQPTLHVHARPPYSLSQHCAIQ